MLYKLVNPDEQSDNAHQTIIFFFPRKFPLSSSSVSHPLLGLVNSLSREEATAQRKHYHPELSDHYNVT